MDGIKYWDNRYNSGGNSGAGSYGKNAKFKGRIINNILDEYKINNIIDFGCGDCNQLNYINLDNIKYKGVDVSKGLIDDLNEKFSNHKFYYFDDIKNLKKSELTMSIDVIYHLVEDHVYDDYMRNLFNKSSKYVLIFSTDVDEKYLGQHVKHRKFTKYVKDNFSEFKLIKRINNEVNVSADFFLFEKIK